MVSSYRKMTTILSRLRELRSNLYQKEKNEGRLLSEPDGLLLTRLNHFIDIRHTEMTDLEDILELAREGGGSDEE